VAASGVARVLIEHGPSLATVILGLAIAADVGYAIVRGARPSRSPALARAGRAGPGPDRSAINGLFGAGPPTADAAPAAAVTDFELTGTIALTDPGSGFGILRRRAQGEQSYRAGETLPGGARLVEVYPERVVVDVGGVLSTLFLPHAGAGSRTGATVARRAPPPRPLDAIVASSPEVPKTLDERRQHPVNVPGSRISRALRPHPLVVDQHVVGYQVAVSGEGTSLPGLPRGALIREINGVPLTDGVVAGRMLDSLATAGSATFVIQDGDGEHSLTVDVSNLAAFAAPLRPAR
jgi:general secretion pathway protein C